MNPTTRPKMRKPSKEFGEAAAARAISIWKTQTEILKQMGYEPDPKSETLRRLKKGDGSDRSARALYDALKRHGVDVSKLPPIYPDDALAKDDWRQEWIWIGEMLQEHALKIYEQNVERLRELARAIARQVGHEREMFRAT